MLELEDIKKLNDKAFNSGQVTRERASDDFVFYHVTQWDDNLLGESQLLYRGEFNIIRKAGRQIMTDLRANPVQVDFDPVDEDRDDLADFADGLYRSSDRHNASIEAYINAQSEAVVCGVGAWKLYTAYESNRAGDERQVIRRKPLYEANNNIFWDPNAKLLDKSDARYVSVLVPYSEDGYKELHEEITGEELESLPPSFSEPEQSYAFPWLGGEEKKIYVTEFYYKDKVKDYVYTLEDPFGETMRMLKSSLEEVMDELIDEGYAITNERLIERDRVTKYIASGVEVLEEVEIPGSEIPVIPMYGERAFVEGEEHYEGITRLAKDPQRLRNFQMSYLADIVSRSPRPKPIFTPEQIQGYEFMYEDNGADNNYPFNYQNATDANGNPLPMGPVGMMPEQSMPTALAQSIQLSRQAVEDVANPGLAQDISDPDLSGEAIKQLTKRLDDQSMVYQQNFKHAKRRDAVVWASMASVVHDVPQQVTLTLPDGTRKKATMMDVVIDRETGKAVTINDISNAEFEVYADIGPDYASKREETVDRLEKMVTIMPPDNPMRQALMLKQLTMIDGVDMSDIREYARKQLVLSGFKEPETEEEEAMLMQAQQAQQPDANMVLAMAEDKKAQADIMREQRENIKVAADIKNQEVQTQIDVFEAQTDRQNVQVNAAKAGAEIDIKQREVALKAAEKSATDVSSIPTDQLLQMLGG